MLIVYITLYLLLNLNTQYHYAACVLLDMNIRLSQNTMVTRHLLFLNMKIFSVETNNVTDQLWLRRTNRQLTEHD